MSLNRKFSKFTEMVTNARENKISASGVIGVLFCIFGLILFITSLSKLLFNCCLCIKVFLMKKIILNEDRLSVLLEYAGYVNVFERLVDYISQKFSESCYRNAAENHKILCR